MHKLTRTIGAALLTAATMSTLPMAVAAQTYPTQAVHLVVPVAPGGPMDMAARLIGQKLSDKWGQPVVIENRPGGGQVIATNSVATAAPDGYTILVMGHVYAMNPWLFATLPYSDDALTPITQMTETPLILVANNDLPVSNVQELVEYARANPDEISFGSSGVSSSLRFAGELLKTTAGIEIEHVPYDGNGPMTVAIIAGEVQIGFVNPVSLPYITEGKVKALAVSSTERLASLPDVPTVAETAGFEGFEAGSWFGLMAPSGTDPAIIAKLNADVNEVLSNPEVVQQLVGVDATPRGRTVEDFTAYIADETKRWGDLIKQLDLKL